MLTSAILFLRHVWSTDREGQVAKLKVFVQLRGHSFRLYRVGRGSRGDRIDGEVSPLVSRLMKVSSNVSDIHFTYPPDGNLHYTYRFSDGREVRGYWDKVEHRPPGFPQGTASLPLGAREAALARDPALLLHCPMLHMLPSYKPAPLEQYARDPEFFQFPAAMTLLDSNIPFFTKDFSSSSRQRKGDVEVEGDTLSSIQILTFLVGRGHAFNYSSPPGFGQSVHKHVVDDRHWPHIHTVVLTG